MSNLIMKDDSITTTHGYYECPECGRKMYAGGPFYHARGCSFLSDGYSDLIYRVGPSCPEYGDAVELKAFTNGTETYIALSDVPECDNCLKSLDDSSHKCHGQEVWVRTGPGDDDFERSWELVCDEPTRQACEGCSEPIELTQLKQDLCVVCFNR